MEPPDPPILPIKPVKHVFQQNGKIVLTLKKGDQFDDKEHCMYVIGKKSLEEGFEFKSRKSNTTRYDVICKNVECKWKIISSISKYGTNWELGTVSDIHTCSRTQLNPNHQNATNKLLGKLLAERFKDHSRVYKPKDIIHDINQEYNIEITYKKAWCGKNKALEINSGCPIESFSKLPYYFYNLKLANQGTVTDIQTDDEGCFKMCFVAFGIALRSFLGFMRPLIVTDGAHLKGTYKGTNMVLVGMDGNNQILPIAVGVSQSETGESWTYFLSKFKECIGEIPYLEIITDRHPGIIQACNSVFANAFHGYCCRHLLMNCKTTTDRFQGMYWKAVKAYTEPDFINKMEEIRGYRPAAYKKLQDAGFGTWSRAMCPVNRYNYMTSNYAESINNLTRHVRKAPITDLMEWYRGLLQKWYCARRKKYKDSNVHALSDWATHKVVKRMHKSTNGKVHGIDSDNQYQVEDGRRVHHVNIFERTCTCLIWQLSGIPCGHVIAVCRTMGCTDCSDLALNWFRKTTLYSTYQELVYPVGKPNNWKFPEGLQVVEPPNMDFRGAGRPRNTNRIKSQGEIPVQVKYSRCGVQGHNRTACHQPLSNNQVSTPAGLKRSRQTTEQLNIKTGNMGGISQQNEQLYVNTNTYAWTQVSGEAYNNNAWMTQHYEPNYKSNYVTSQAYESSYTIQHGGTQEYEVQYANNYQGSQAYGQSWNNMGLFNMGQSSQQTYSAWDNVNLGDP